MKSLGPGSYKDPDETTYPNQTGDVKLEANMEYRFKLFWKLEAALFMDVGNIWSLSRRMTGRVQDLSLTVFIRSWLLEQEWVPGLYSVSLYFRFDLGIPLRNPYPIEGSNWLPGNSGITGRDLTFNLAIGYPF